MTNKIYYDRFRQPVTVANMQITRTTSKKRGVEFWITTKPENIDDMVSIVHGPFATREQVTDFCTNEFHTIPPIIYTDGLVRANEMLID